MGEILSEYPAAKQMCQHLLSNHDLRSQGQPHSGQAAVTDVFPMWFIDRMLCQPLAWRMEGTKYKLVSGTSRS